MKRRFKTWVKIFFFGVLLFVGTEQALRLTGNLNLFPTVVLLGAFVIPITFVAYFYEQVRHQEIPLTLLTNCFIVGGVIGLITAGIIEYSTLETINFGGLVSISIIEEWTKLLFPLLMYVRWQYRHEADGLLFGVAAGMGFAALETMGYAMVGFIQSGGDADTLQRVLLVRGFLSPAGHAAWTGFFCAVLWRERERAVKMPVNWKVLGAFGLSVLLHTLWNYANSVTADTSLELALVIISNVFIAGVSLMLIIRRYLSARAAASTLPPPLPPETPPGGNDSCNVP